MNAPSSGTPLVPRTPRAQRFTLAIILCAALIFAAWIASPLWVGILLGAMIAFTVQPIYERVLARLSGRRSLAAALVTIGSGIVVAAIGAAVIYVLTREMLGLVATLRERLASGSVADLIGEKPARALEAIGLDRHALVSRASEKVDAAASFVAGAATIILARMTSAVLGLFIALLTTYYVLLQWPLLVSHLERIVPLEPRYTRALMLEFRQTSKTVLIGTIATAVVQGVFATVGYLIAGVPHAVAWGVVTAICSFLPVVGTAIAYVPIGVILIATGHALGGSFVIAWGVLVVMAVSDYVIRPRIVGEKGHSHPLLMLVALLGGVEVVGLAGLVVGPIAMSLLLAVIRMYERANVPQTSDDRPSMIT